MCGDGEGDCSRDSDCSGSLVRFTFTLVLNFHFSTILVFGVVGEIPLYFGSNFSLLGFEIWIYTDNTLITIFHTNHTSN